MYGHPFSPLVCSAVLQSVRIAPRRVFLMFRMFVASLLGCFFHLASVSTLCSQTISTYSVNGINIGDLFGSSVSGVGDINGDGFDDFAAGAIYGGGTGRPGTVTVFSGVDGSTIYNFMAACQTDVSAQSSKGLAT